MDFFTLIIFLLLTHRGAGVVKNGSCSLYEPFQAKLFYGRVINWIPDNFGHSPFNRFDGWHFQSESVVEIFVSSSESIVLNVTLRCQQPNPVTGQLPPLSVWTGRQKEEPNEWSDKNFSLWHDDQSSSLVGCKQKTNDTTAYGWLQAEKREILGWKQNIVSCNFINEFVIARRNQTQDTTLLKVEPASTPAEE